MSYSIFLLWKFSNIPKSRENNIMNPHVRQFQQLPFILVPFILFPSFPTGNFPHRDIHLNYCISKSLKQFFYFGQLIHKLQTQISLFAFAFFLTFSHKLYRIFTWFKIQIYKVSYIQKIWLLSLSPSSYSLLFLQVTF